MFASFLFKPLSFGEIGLKKKILSSSDSVKEFQVKGSWDVDGVHSQRRRVEGKQNREHEFEV